MRKKTKCYVAVCLLAALSLTAGCKDSGETDGKNPPDGATLSPAVSGTVAGNVGEDTPGSYETYTEAPMLQALVAAKKLPMAERRLPDKENVLTVEEVTVGVYGDDVQFAAQNADTVTGELVSEGLFRYAKDGTIAPNIAKGYTVNGDFTQYTIYLREGMHWSDGVRFTSDDCIFFYEKMCLPETFGEPLWQCFTVYDEFGMPKKAEFKKLDEYSFQVTFPLSKPEFLAQLLEQGGICFAPEHYHVNLMPEYMGEDAAAAKAKDMGYADVEEMLEETVVNAWNTPGVPTLNPFCLSTEEGANDVTGDYYEFVRNPYYWKVDAEGKQLPYLDRLGFTRISGESQKMLLTTEGFLSISPLSAEQVEEAQAGTARGDYRMIKWTNFSFYAVKNGLKNFPESCPYEEKIRGIGAAHAECWYME